ncbi:MAG: terpene cyclase/mutase family protein [Myxococcales bacterium]|nr:terpene cyclase/mutase family protein [Myxococcales bacterium]MCB9537443.1 terpene cyclase/mutase family protein [Myxococcales bacterium]
MRRTLSFLALALVPLVATAADKPSTRLDPQLEKAAKAAVDKGIAFLQKQQSDNGSYSHHVGLTSMALIAYATSYHHYEEESGSFVGLALNWLTAQQRPDGSISGETTPTYNTALAILAINDLTKTGYRKFVTAGQKYLATGVRDEGEGVEKSDKYFGGMGYDHKGRSDLSNLHFGLEALRDTDYDPDSEIWAKAQLFVSRCQNRSESNDQPWAGDDGGFTYRPGGSSSGNTDSYGAMTFAGLKSLMFTRAKKDDPRVKAAWSWIQKHYGFNDHPGHGTTAYYYYLETAASALHAYGERYVVDARGRKHDWAADLAARLVSLQKPDGSWVNDNVEYWEGNKLLVTARAVIALNHALAAASTPEKK